MDNSSSATPGNIPKRGSRACTACRKGKNKCEGEAPCRRCQLSGQPCVFEKPEKKNGQLLSTASFERRLSSLEGQYLVMQRQMIGLQTSLDRILAAITQPGAPGVPPGLPSIRRRSVNVLDMSQMYPEPSEDESEQTFSRSSLDAPIEALQGLANAAEAAAAPSFSAPRFG